jgi:hypothetical protein
MKTLTAIRALLCVMIVLGSGIILVAAAPASQEAATWKYYQDPDYGFSIEYDADHLESKVTVYTPNDPDPLVIAKRVSFIGPKAVITVDIWKHPEIDLVRWYA